MSVVPSLALPLLLLGIWALVSVSATIDPIFLPSPWEVSHVLFLELLSGTLLVDTATTVVRAASGFLVSAAVGVPLGLLIGRVPVLARATQPTIDFFRSIPATALFPLFLLLLGLGDASRIAVVFYACSLVITVYAAYGARQVNPTRLLAARVLGATRFDLVAKIVLPESSPSVFAGLRIALSMSFVLIIVSEMFIGTTSGLGFRITDAQSVYRTSAMYAAILMAGVSGYLANALLLAIERRNLHWVGK